MADIEALKKAIKDLHGLDAVHVGSEAVHERFQGKTVWQGVVEIFDVSGHPTATKCYAWSHRTGPVDAHERTVTVLRVPPINSALAAVQASIASEIRGRIDGK